MRITSAIVGFALKLGIDLYGFVVLFELLSVASLPGEARLRYYDNTLHLLSTKYERGCNPVPSFAWVSLSPWFVLSRSIFPSSCVSPSFCMVMFSWHFFLFVFSFGPLVLFPFFRFIFSFSRVPLVRGGRLTMIAE